MKLLIILAVGSAVGWAFAGDLTGIVGQGEHLGNLPVRGILGIIASVLTAGLLFKEGQVIRGNKRRDELQKEMLKIQQAMNSDLMGLVRDSTAKSQAVIDTNEATQGLLVENKRMIMGVTEQMHACAENREAMREISRKLGSA